jgi:ADP-ribosyl-[dinitrogen reductase] hydrolase
MKADERALLRIDSVRLPTGGEIGMTICPGKKQIGAISGDWDRDLAEDLDVIARWGASAVVSVILAKELRELKVHDLGDEVIARKMSWYHLPVPDGGVPDFRFEEIWVQIGSELRGALRAGKKILIHCKGGLGRTGTVAARLMVELGEAPDDAIRKVREARRGAIENFEQEQHIRNCRNLTAPAGGRHGRARKRGGNK